MNNRIYMILINLKKLICSIKVDVSLCEIIAAVLI